MHIYYHTSKEYIGLPFSDRKCSEFSFVILFIQYIDICAYGRNTLKSTAML